MIDINSAGLSAITILLTKQLINALLEKGAITREELQTLFERANNDLLQTTLPATTEELHAVLRIFWPGFIESDKTHH